MNQDLSVFVTPFALVIGCALIAAGGLYFIEIQFLKSRLQAIAALVAGSLVLAALEVVLAGSSVSFFKAQQVQTSACELEGESAHPEARLGVDVNVIHKHILGCMQEAGYEWAPAHRNCKDAPVATNAYCYLPATGFERAITAFQLRFE
ncbi:hypothetical protein MSC49_23850 [Methylosinus sp. C49]|jgi:hypothetical protein|uniref:hypothetical protein n=1 Tax=Methylosinus sp. C49 TaxID=2699395 RepID=UPI001366BB97|nr:hypothetical protein [Methylosinus sp. C49]BBU62450.1 hypothetical protein MSC49_23850 [Methylosinus sp. C49]